MRPLTYQHQIHVNFFASVTVPFFLNTTASRRQPLCLRCSSGLPGMHFPPIGMHQMMYRYQILLPKFSPRWITEFSEMKSFVIHHCSHLILTTPFPTSPPYFAQKTPPGRAMLCSRSHSDVFTTFLSLHLLQTKIFRAFLLTTCTCLKPQYTALWSSALLHFLFHCSDSGFLSIWII